MVIANAYGAATIGPLRSARVVRTTIGENDRQRNPELRAQNGGWDIDADGNIYIQDGTDYHMLTIMNPEYDPNKPIDPKTNPKYLNINPQDSRYQEAKENESIWNDIFKLGITNPATLFENAGSRNGWTGGKRVLTISADEIQKYKDEYDQVINDPELLQAYYDATARFQKFGGSINYLQFFK